MPHTEHRRAQCQDAVGVARAEFIGEALRRGAQGLGVFDKGDDFLQRALAGRTQDAAFEQAVEVERSGEQVVAGGLGHGAGFAGEVGFVACAFALGNTGVRGHLLAADDAHRHARAQVGDRHLDFRARVVEHGGRARRAVQERADLALGASPARSVPWHPTR